MSNDFTPFVPEWWANESLAQLWEHMVVMNLVHRDFEFMFAQYGDIVNTRRLTATRKAKSTDIVAQDVTAENVAVPLDQHCYTSFVVHDLDQRSSFKDLIQTYLMPAGMALAQQADKVILGQAAQFLYAGNVYGRNDQAVYNNLVDTRTGMDNQLAYEEGRVMILSPNTEGKLLKDTNLYRADAAGTTRIFRKGEIGDLVNWSLFKAHHAADVSLNTAAVGLLTLTLSAAVKGATSITAAAQTSPTTIAGNWVSIFGQPFKITGVSGAGPFTWTLNRALPFDVPASTPGYVTKPISLATSPSSYAAGYTETIELAPAANQYIPSLGSYLEFGSKIYAVIQKSGNFITLDRPIETALTTASDTLQVLPPGSYNFGFHRNCMTAAIRPLAPVPAGRGVQSAVASFNGLTVRATMGYNMTKQQTQVTLDFLMGTKVLDNNLGSVMVG
jgi:hypothetical protein